MKLLSVQKASRGHIVPGGLEPPTSFKSAKFGKVKNYSKMIHCFYFLSHCFSESRLVEN